MAAGIFSLLPISQSCLKSDDNYDYDLARPDAIVTVKPLDDASFYMQLNDNTTLYPVGETELPFGNSEMRAFVNYDETDMPQGVEGSYSQAVKINWIKSILTKDPVVTEGDVNDETKYGSDPVEIMNDWMTNVEDGYITLHFFTCWGNSGIKHEVNLVTGTNPENPYEVVFRHNAFNDYCNVKSDGIVAFSLKNLPDTNGETVKLTLKWESFSGTKSVEFDYCTRQEK